MPPSCACSPLVIPKPFPVGRVGPSPGSRHGSGSPSRSTASLPCSPGRTPETTRVSRGGTTNNGCGPKTPAPRAHPVAPHSSSGRAVGHAGGVPSRGTPLKLIIPQEQGHTPTRNFTGPAVVNGPPQSRDAKGGGQSSVRAKPGGARTASPLASSSTGPSPPRKAVVLTAAQGHQKPSGAISAVARSPVGRTRVAPQGPGGTA